MTADPLTTLQRRVLAVLAPIRPAWTLTGGAALAGFHLRHRATRDLDLFWHGLSTFAGEPEHCIAALQVAGMQADVLQRTPGFVRLRVLAEQEAVVVDLVAEPVAAGSPPQTAATDGGTIQVDTAQEILANKLGALLHRAELRDLVDIRALLALGCDLTLGLREAANKDLGFSPLMVGHLLHQFPVERQATANGLDAAAAAELAAFARDLAVRIAAVARP